MTTLLLSHPVMIEHAPPEGHPERPDRLKVIERILATAHFDALMREEAPLATAHEITRAHADDYYHRLEQAAPEEGMEQLDPDTWMSPRSFEAALRGVG